MATEFEYNMQLAQAQIGATKSKEAEIEDRKDKRVKIQGHSTKRAYTAKTNRGYA